MCDCDGPQAFCSRMRVARKDHKCCECYGVIAKGQQYEYASGVWDDGPNDFKTCAECADARKSYVAELTRYDCQPCFGELYDEWSESEIPPHAAINLDAARQRAQAA